jgi:hypothetical protein
LLLGSLLALAASGCTSDAPIAVEDSGMRSDAGEGEDGGSLDGGSTDGGAECPTDLFTADGMPCSVEGQWCGECPGGPCTFCNRIQCVSGRWQRFEAFPDPACMDGGPACARFGESCASTACCTDMGLTCDGESSTCHDSMGGALGDGETCDPAASRCGAGSSCCYPCGIPDCDYVCEPTCDPSDPSCVGGCMLRP